jgi:TetR/AcrR family transcriptional regulator, transcriptional repressor for nem operon
MMGVIYTGAMGRASRAEAAAHREQVVAAAARLFRERGVHGVSLSDLMADVGLTHGGFYRQFASKDALAAEAAASALEARGAAMREITERHPDDRAAARREMLDCYLSADHRDDPGTGCPTSALAGEVAHEGADSALRATYTGGVRSFVDLLADFDGDTADRDHRITTLCTMVGAILLSRATSGDPISDEILDAAKRHLESTVD